MAMYESFAPGLVHSLVQDDDATSDSSSENLYGLYGLSTDLDVYQNSDWLLDNHSHSTEQNRTERLQVSDPLEDDEEEEFIPQPLTLFGSGGYNNVRLSEGIVVSPSVPEVPVIVDTVEVTPSPRKNTLTIPSEEDLKDVDRECLASLDWNERYQLLRNRVSRIDNQTKCGEKIKICSFLAALCKDFNSTAQMFGKIIISERYLPPGQKTIRPVSAEMGGSAGGEKYIASKILFKFATDHHGLYGGGDDGDMAAAKAAGHDLKGLMLFDFADDSLALPLMTLVDYRGFRLLAMSVLPISDDTLVYGSSDAGHTVFMSNDGINEKLRKVAQDLNLKTHMAGLPANRGGSPKDIHTAVDIEGHIGLDGRQYILDFARTLPPELPNKKDPRYRTSHLHRLLRYELVKTNPVPLCADAFSGFIFGHEGFDTHNQEVADATKRLFTEVIPEVARDLDEMALLSPDRAEQLHVTERLHRDGVNMRHLGRVRSLCQAPCLRRRLLIEAVARASKCILFKKLRMQMKRFRYPQEQPYHALAVNFFNLMFGTSKASDIFWNGELKAELMFKFSNCLSLEERGNQHSIKRMAFCNGICNGRESSSERSSPLPLEHKSIALLFRRLQKLTGIKFGSRVKHTLCGDAASVVHFVSIAEPLDESDLKSMDPIVKHPISIEVALGIVNKVKAFRHRDDAGSPWFRYFMDRCITHLSNALMRQPRNVKVLHFSVVMHLAFNVANDKEKINIAVVQAKRMYAIDPKLSSQLFIPLVRHFHEDGRDGEIDEILKVVRLVHPEVTPASSARASLA
eukprot:TRINITY_DN5584_c0_g1_i3.p1 TRINITY_DN5584_c0_g1~~TRINITY_DN5584_c0_g1_i3.p1  ORF type:complete len:797 (-),score=127.78 TRINITY_DN5584_c0_g1_i3:65-2455(-)